MFKTIKYDIDHPPRFDDIDHARAWTQAFLDRYANHHRHSGIGYHPGCRLPRHRRHRPSPTASTLAPTRPHTPTASDKPPAPSDPPASTLANCPHQVDNFGAWRAASS
ncbi:MAG: transposase [Micropruina sp.]|nr:transposase [Micropruina sp.]